jgi:hypothetical protein
VFSYCFNRPIDSLDIFGLYLTTSHQITISLVWGLGAAAGAFLGGGLLTSGLIGGAAGAIAAAMMEGNSLENVVHNGMTRMLSGFASAGFVGLVEGAVMHGMRAAALTGGMVGLSQDSPNEPSARPEPAASEHRASANSKAICGAELSICCGSSADLALTERS